MMKMQSRKIWYYRITLIILLFAMLLAWALLPGVHEFINCNQVNHLIPTRVLVKGGEITCKMLK